MKMKTKTNYSNKFLTLVENSKNINSKWIEKHVVPNYRLSWTSSICISISETFQVNGRETTKWQLQFMNVVLMLKLSTVVDYYYFRFLVVEVVMGNKVTNCCYLDLSLDCLRTECEVSLFRTLLTLTILNTFFFKLTHFEDTQWPNFVCAKMCNESVWKHDHMARVFLFSTATTTTTTRRIHESHYF